MKVLAVIVCTGKRAKPVSKVGHVLFNLKKILHVVKKENVREWTEKVSLYEDLSVDVIKLPYSEDELCGLLLRKVKRLINDYCAQNGVTRCIFSKNLKKLMDDSSMVNDSTDEKLFFKLLLPVVLDAIFSGTEIKTGNIDICIIQGNNQDELFAFIDLLSPAVKCILIVAKENDKESVRDKINRIYDETGMSIGLSTDLKSAVKNAGIIINLGNAGDFPHTLRIGHNALFLNFSQGDAGNITDECIVINGVETMLPQNTLIKLGKCVFEHINMGDVSKAILNLRFACDGNGSVVLPGKYPKLTRQIYTEFKREGCGIIAFRGRHGFLSLKDVRSALKNAF